VVPVQSKPTFSLGSQAVFTALKGRTEPQFRVEWPAGGGTCGPYPLPTAGATPSAPNDSSKGVNVIDVQEVGPFEIVVLESKDSAALLDWLNKNKFDQPASSLPLIDHYVQQGMLFVALRLKKDASTGDLQPLVLDMDSPEPCVPLILTKIAATRDMPVSVYVLGAGRAAPRNWFEVKLNPRKINWLTGGTNYRQVATAAIDEAAGHAFVTEYAGPSSIMKDTLYRAGQYDLTRVLTATAPQMFLQAVFGTGLPRDQKMMSLLRKYLPEPVALREKGISERDFYNGVFFGQYMAELAGVTVDAVKFAAELQETVITPLKQAQAMFDSQPYLTRLLSTVSPEEMNRDPLFHLNRDLPTVDNVHVAKASGMCGSDGLFHNVKLTFDDGQTLSLDGPVQPWRNPGATTWTYAQAEPAAMQIALIGPSGGPTVITKGQALAADQMLMRGETPETIRRSHIPDPMNPTTVNGGTSSGGCSVGGAGGGVGLLALAALAGVVIRRRRR
jgi:MYXO-CTERM domain-containing protein